MRIGIFDSGLGGLLVLKKIAKKLPQYDYLYLGDAKRAPFGNRSQNTIYQFTKEAIEYLFAKNCQLVILACNTASAGSLKKIQREYLARHYPERRVLGVIIPTVETAATDKKIKRAGILATGGTVNSNAFVKEFKKTAPFVKTFQQAAPLLVPFIENNGIKFAGPALKQYLAPLFQKKVETIVLGCTHYALLKNKIRKITGGKIKIISQDELIPEKLADYLARHPEIEKKLSKNRKITFAATDITPDFERTAKKWFGKNIELKLAKYY